MKFSSCPCWSGLSYKHCCQPYHLGQSPFNALVLMRSRYSAYALGLAEYIIKTTHPEHPDSKKKLFERKQEILAFSKNTLFTNLTILFFEEHGLEAIVIFTAGLSTLDNKDCSFTEKSYFEKIGEQWFYLKGIID